ncbi:MAG: hypothetical protein WA705_11240 [Candidatus Ozemobacteraceae bacterium]
MTSQNVSAAQPEKRIASKAAPGAATGNFDKEPAKHGLEWERVGILAGVIFLLFFYTRSCPFPAGTFWDLASARDFDLGFGWIVMPETLALWIVQSSASVIGLKVAFHLGFFFLCAVLTVWIFKGPEVLPGLIILGIFTFALQPLLSFRWIFQLIFIAGILSMFHGTFLRNSFGYTLIPVTAAAAGMGLESWLMVGIIAIYCLTRQEYRLSLILCALIGMLFFPEGAAASITTGFPLSTRFPHPEDVRSLQVIAGLLLVPNLIAMSLIQREDLPLLICYAILGVLSLIAPTYLPAFILVGVMLLLKVFNDISPLTLNVRLTGVLLLGIFVYLFLFMGPGGFRLNSVVRGDSGLALEPFLSFQTSKKLIPAYELGELMWKGIINPTPTDLSLINPGKTVPIVLESGAYHIEFPANTVSEVPVQASPDEPIYIPPLDNEGQ